ncbi:MAG: RagB/SusD family nutrient uptake outer membrane protein [Prevotella sp.]|nr:RagB/SusD family nutrient uptake outer membrane protein [Prevotella sp.]
MKKLFSQHIIALIAATMLAACELDYAPENTYVDEKVYRTEKTAEAALAGAYVRLNVFLSGAPQDQNNYSNTGDVFLLADLTTENLKVQETSASYVAIESSEFSSNEHDGVLTRMWLNGYNAIDFANNIITGIETYGEYDQQKQRRHIAEARFIRAYINFMLLAIYGDQALQGNTEGDGIVLKSTPYTGYNPDAPEARSSNAQCWANIIGDLEAAIPDLDEAVPAPVQRTHANRAVAQALLSRVLLYKATAENDRETLQKAADLAKTVLDTPGYAFAATPSEYVNNLFPSNEYSQTDGYPNPTSRSGELVFFEPSRIYTDNYPNGLGYYRKLAYYIPQEAIDVYDASDVRRTYLIAQGSPTDNPNYFTSAKYLGGNYDDVIYIRLAEMKLTYAEATVRATGRITTDALDELNAVRSRAFNLGQKPAPYTLNDFPTQDDFLRAVLKERRLELAYEGHYRWDLMRTNNLLGDARLAAIAPNRWNLPVPDYEIRLTEQRIRQNSGYR